MSKIVIIGSSIAGISAAEAAKKQDPTASVKVYSKDRFYPYYRLRVGEILASRDMSEKLYLHPEKWYEDNGIELNLDKEVNGIDPEKKTISLVSGETVSYDKLILAQGSHSFVPPIKGADLEGVLTLWTMSDALKIEDAIEHGENCVVIGGGLLGLETAYHIAKKGISTTIVETADRLLARQLDEDGSRIFTEQVKRQHVTPIVKGNITEIKADESGKHCVSVDLADGTSLPADVVIISTGVRPNVNILDGTGIEIGRFVKCTDKMETSLPDIYAAGDVMEQDGSWFGQWSISKAQGTVAGTNAAGGDASYTLLPPPYILNTMGTKVAAGGRLKADGDPDYSEDVELDEANLLYHKVSVSDGGVVGFALIGDTKDYMKLSKKMKEDA